MDEDEAVGERLDAEGPQEVGVGELRDEGELVVELGEAQRAGCPRPSQQQRGGVVAPARAQKLPRRGAVQDLEREQGLAVVRVGGHAGAGSVA